MEVAPQPSQTSTIRSLLLMQQKEDQEEEQKGQGEEQEEEEEDGGDGRGTKRGRPPGSGVLGAGKSWMKMDGITSVVSLDLSKVKALTKRPRFTCWTKKASRNNGLCLVSPEADNILRVSFLCTRVQIFVTTLNHFIPLWLLGWKRLSKRTLT